MMQFVMGRFVAHAIGVAATYDLATHLAAGPLTAGALAAKAGVDEGAMRRLLRALASVGVFAETAPGTFTNTPLSETLRSDVPGSLRAVALFFNHDQHVKAWLGLAHSVKTGGSGVEHVHGRPVWDVLAGDADFSKTFNDAMTSLSWQMAHAIIGAYDFSGIGELADIGGGHGQLLGAILQANPAMRGVVFDLPAVVTGTGAVLQGLGVADRARVVGGDFFVEVPAADAYIMAHILHDWSDTDAVRILSSIRRAMRPGARLLVAEAVVRPGNEPDGAKFLDLEMLVITSGGVERTEEEWHHLLGQAGFRLERIVPTPSMVSLIEARTS